MPAYQNVRRLPGYAGIVAVAVVAILLAWCNLTQAAGTPRVILLRGWFGVFSMGLDTLTDELKGLGINAEVAGHLSWQNEVAEILRERAAGGTGPLILVGHSQGANNVIDMARELEPSHVTVALLITLSPFMQNLVPANVVKAIDYYQAPGWGEPLEAEPDFHGQLINVNLASIRPFRTSASTKTPRFKPQSCVRSPPSNNGCAGSAAGRSAVASIHQAFDTFQRQYLSERSGCAGTNRDI